MKPLVITHFATSPLPPPPKQNDTAVDLREVKGRVSRRDGDMRRIAEPDRLCSSNE